MMGQGGESGRSELVSFDMPPLASSTPGRFSGQVVMPAGASGALKLASKEALNALIKSGASNGVGVAIWPSKAGAILYSGEVVGTQMNGIGLIEFPSARSTWSMATGKFENGAFSFGRASAGDVLDFIGQSWQEFILSNIQANTFWTASEFKGQWKNGYPSQGITVLPDGSKHVGSWKDGKFHDSCLFVDSDGNWIKGIFQKGELICVTFRSLAKCNLPQSCAHLLNQAEVANISADVLQGEYKSFVEIADKLAVQGMEMSKLAKSISNIAYLKSEEVLGLPAHAVESSLNSLAHLLHKSNPGAKVVNASSPCEVKPDAPLQAANALASSLACQGQQQAVLQMLLQMKKGLVPSLGRLSGAGNAGQGGQQQQQMLTDLLKERGIGVPADLRAYIPKTAQRVGGTVETPVASTSRSQGPPGNVPKKAKPCKFVGLLSVNPPVITIKETTKGKQAAGNEDGGVKETGRQGNGQVKDAKGKAESQKIVIEGYCSSREEIDDISILCISGNKFVRCDTVLKDLSISPNLYSDTPVTNFVVHFAFRPEYTGITHFLFASKASEKPFSASESAGPCKAELEFNGELKDYHVLPLVVLPTYLETVREEILRSFKNLDLVGYQSHYQNRSKFLQALGAALGDGAAREPSALENLMLTSSDMRMPLTLAALAERKEQSEAGGQQKQVPAVAEQGREQTAAEQQEQPPVPSEKKESPAEDQKRERSPDVSKGQSPEKGEPVLKKLKIKLPPPQM
ncbi:hypothetical protein HOP50_01g04850 [Chloropicon primus]|nr:hypothetical protein HOP50_01g04850 [Chloropicon primus]